MPWLAPSAAVVLVLFHRFALALVRRGVAAAPAGAQSVGMSDVYGRGVHAYFSDQASTADQYLSQVIDAGSTDPRVYYYRAMARLRHGQRYEAIDDMRIGAAYEARDPGAAGNVGQALMRVQGSDRQLLEQYRRDARVAQASQQPDAESSSLRAARSPRG